MLGNTRIIDFRTIGKELGKLIPLEACREVPFEIKRIYYITSVPPNVTRGFHSHKTLEQVLICVSGSVKIRIKTPFEEDVMTLDSAEQGLYIGPMIWREMFDFSEHAVLLTLASEYYNEEDYIRDYETYIKESSQYIKGSTINGTKKH